MPPLQKKVSTQSTTIVTCSDFGANHQHVKYPTIFFCSNFDLCDQRDTANSRLNHEMKKYECTAQHSLLDDKNPQQQQQTGYRDLHWSRTQP